MDVFDSALGVGGELRQRCAARRRAIEVAPNRVEDANLAQVFRIFGRPARTATCDCERSMEPAIPQTLFLMSDPTVLKKITDGPAQEAAGGKEDR